MDAFNQIAAILIASCQAQAPAAALHAEARGDAIEIRPVCIAQDGSETPATTTEPGRAIMLQSITAIRDDMARQTGASWSTATFTVRDGRFDLQIGYPD